MNKLKFLIIFAAFKIFPNATNAQSLEIKLATSACRYCDSIPIMEVVTPQDKKKVLTFIFAKAVAANQEEIEKDKRFEGLNSYEQGKKLGQILAQNILPIIIVKCPKFMKLF